MRWTGRPGCPSCWSPTAAVPSVTPPSDSRHTAVTLRSHRRHITVTPWSTPQLPSYPPLLRPSRPDDGHVHLSKLAMLSQMTKPHV